jgi:hypothetical protein
VKGARVFAGDGAEWLKEPPSMTHDIEKQLADMFSSGREPGAIIMTPPQLRRWLNELSHTPGNKLDFDDIKGSSGWKFMSVPIYRSWEIVGPCVVTMDVRDALLKMGRYPRVGASRGPMHAATAVVPMQDLEPLLF